MKITKIFVKTFAEIGIKYHDTNVYLKFIDYSLLECWVVVYRNYSEHQNLKVLI